MTLVETSAAAAFLDHAVEAPSAATNRLFTLTTQKETATVSIDIQPAGRDLIADWQFDTPKTTLTFSGDTTAPEQRLSDWSLDQRTWAFDGTTLRRKDGAAFDRLRIRLQPSTQFIDRHYIPLSQIGDAGWLLRVNALMPDEDTVNISFSGFPSGTVLLKDAKKSRLSRQSFPDASSVLFIGPSSYLTEGATQIIADPDMPIWASMFMIDQYDAAYKKLSALFGPPSTKNPTLVYSWQSGGALKHTKASVTNGMMVFHFRGYRDDREDVWLKQTLAHQVFHEAVHYWNASTYVSDAGADQPWLHEGLADYLAARLLLSRRAFAETAQDALINCQLSIQHEGLLQGTDHPYQCGFLVNLIAETALYAETGETIVDVWQDIFSKSESGRYSVESFRETVTRRLSPGSQQLIHDLLDGRAFDTSMLDREALAAIGIKTQIVSNASGGRLPGWVLEQLLNEHCSGPSGFLPAPDGYYLDTGNHCGFELSGDHKITHVNKVSMLTAPAEAYRSVRRTCRRGGRIEFIAVGEKLLFPVQCGDSLARLPDLFEISALPRLPELSPN